MFTAYFLKRKLRRAIVNKTINLNNLQCVDLSHMNLSSIDIRGAKLNSAILENTNFKNTILQGAVLTKAKLMGANLQGANLIYVDFTDADLRGANMRNTSLSNAIFRNADLRGADLTNAKIDISTNFMQANMENIIVDEDKVNKAINAGAVIKPLKLYDRVLYTLGFRDRFLKDKVPTMKQIVPISNRGNPRFLNVASRHKVETT
jgi:uncharacterized protein YjbI with pentapeptide repeats